VTDNLYSMLRKRPNCPGDHSHLIARMRTPNAQRLTPRRPDAPV
jgi:hypothetical protein